MSVMELSDDREEQTLNVRLGSIIDRLVAQTATPRDRDEYNRLAAERVRRLKPRAISRLYEKRRQRSKD